MTSRTLHIFIPHSSDILTDHLSNGDGLIANGFIRHLAQRGHVLYVTAPNADLRVPLPPNVHLKIIRTRTGSGAFSRIEYMIRVRKHFQNIRRHHHIDLIHQLNPVFAGISLALWDAHHPLVLGTFVARWPDEPSASLLRRTLSPIISTARETIARLQQQQADILLLTAPAARNRLYHDDHEEHIEARIRWLGHGVDCKTFSPASDAGSPQRLRLEQEQPSILFLANLVERKGVFPLLQAFALVLRAIPNCRLTFAGDGPLKEELIRRSKDMGIAGSIDFLGRVARAEAPALFRSHAVYCLPAFGEPYATSILEAMACGRPIVLTNTGGIPHMVPEDGGLRVPPHDPEALASALVRLLTNSELRRTMGAANRHRAATTMTWPNIINDLEAIYYDLLAQHDAPCHACATAGSASATS